MSKRLSCALFSLSFLLASPALGQTGNPASGSTGAADLCQELLAYAEKKAAEPPKDGSRDQAAALPAAPPPRRDDAGSGTQGGGSVGPSSSADTSSQGGAPTTTPIAPGAASEPATSPHASDGSSEPAGASRPGTAENAAEFSLGAGITLSRVRETAERNDRQACRDVARTLRRAGVDLPAGLIALAAYEPDPAKR